MTTKTRRFLFVCSRLVNPLAMPTKFIALVCYGMVACQLHGQPAAFPNPQFWLTDGPVNAILATNGMVYIGGDFSYVGPHTGPLVLFDQTTGGLQAVPPPINGTIKTVVSDGAGGWFIGGTFTSIGTTAITNIAHLNRDLTLDINWNANLVGSTVNALALDSGVLYIGGSFSKINGLAVQGLAGVDVTNPVVSWNPLLAGSVNALQVTNGLVFVGGNFFSVGNSNVQNVAEISTSTALANSFNPSTVDSTVFTLFVTPTDVYVGGQFSTIGTKSRNRLAELDINTAVATSWNPNPNGIVRALWITTTNAYVGGDFTTISVANRRGFASIGLTGAGSAQPLDLALQSVGTANLVDSILLQGTSLYVGGQFTNALAQPHYLVVGVNITNSLTLAVPRGTDFNGPAGAVYGANALASANGKVLIGGAFQSFGGVARMRAAALSLTTGAALPWAPGFDAPVLSLACGTNCIYVGGSFTNYNTTNAIPSLGQGLGAVDPILGNPLSFNFLATNSFGSVSINSVVTSPGALYVGGAFTTVNGQPRRFLAALDPSTGNLISGFNANLGGGFAGVSALAVAGTNLYVGGDFTTVNTLAIPRLTEVSLDTGTSINWIPTPNQTVTGLSATADTLNVIGNFTSINLNGSGAITLNYFAAFSLVDGSLVPIDAALPSFSTASAVAATPTVIYLGGSFTSAGGNFDQNVASLSAIDATGYAWNPSPDVGPNAIALTDDYAFLGGTFRSFGQSPTNHVYGFFAAFDRSPQIQAQSSTPGNIQINLTTGDRTDAVLQGAMSLKKPVWTDLQTYDPGFPQSVLLPSTSPQQYFRVKAD
jgi:trimeric autotransporter adhesin